MKTGVDISLYPLGEHYRPRIQAFIDRLNTHPDLLVETNALSTQIWGELAEVMRVLTLEMERAAEGAPQLVFIIKVLPTLAPPAHLSAPAP
jgi:uncharacterized protein YqgV (UPF0045/DUF77 family)